MNATKRFSVSAFNFVSDNRP